MVRRVLFRGPARLRFVMGGRVRDVGGWDGGCKFATVCGIRIVNFQNIAVAAVNDQPSVMAIGIDGVGHINIAVAVGAGDEAHAMLTHDCRDIPNSDAPMKGSVAPEAKKLGLRRLQGARGT